MIVRQDRCHRAPLTPKLRKCANVSRLNAASPSAGQKTKAGTPWPSPVVRSAVVDQANAALEAHELIKCSALENSGLSAREAADQLAELTGSEVVQVIGRRFSLYRETSREGVEKIQLD